MDTQLQLFDSDELSYVENDSFGSTSSDAKVISILTDVRRISLPILSIRSFFYTPPSPVPELLPELLTEHSLVFVIEGALTQIINGITYTAKAGECLYSSPGSLICRPENADLTSYMTICFWDDTPHRIGQTDDTIFAYPHKMPYDDDVEVSATVNYLQKVCASGTPDQRKKCLAALQLLLIQLEDFVMRYSDNAYVREMKQYMLNHYREGVQLEDLAAHVGLHPVYCAKIFKKFEGITVGDFINQLRISRAAAQLESAIETSDVAKDLGLSEFYFSRWFRRMTGVTPTEYRDTLRAAYVKS